MAGAEARAYKKRMARFIERRAVVSRIVERLQT
jgi:hypothetical protein